MSKLDFDDVLGLGEWYDEFCKSIALSEEGNNSPCVDSAVTDLIKFEIQMEGAKKDEEKYAIYYKAVMEATRKAAPIFECAWTACDGMFERGLTWFEGNKETEDFKAWHDNYNHLKSNESDINTLEAYHKCAAIWREETGYEINENTSSLDKDLCLTYAVSNTNVDTILRMLVDMKTKSDERLKRGGGSVRLGTGVSDEHTGWMERWIKGKCGLLSTPPWGSWKKENKTGRKLAATAIANLTQKTGSKVISEAKERHSMVVATVHDQDEVADLGLILSAVSNIADDIGSAIQEAEDLLDQSKAQTPSAYHQQVAAMDVVFSSYYWLWRIKINRHSYSYLSQWLFELGQHPIGNKKVRTMLGALPFQWSRNLLGLFANDTFNGNKMYIHPGVLTRGRLSDMAACFGAFPVGNPHRILEGSGNPRFLLNLRRDGENPCAQTVTNLFRVFSSGFDYKNMEIVPPEDMLHQSFLGKTSPFQRAAGHDAGFQEVNIVASKHERGTKLDSKSPYVFTTLLEAAKQRRESSATETPPKKEKEKKDIKKGSSPGAASTGKTSKAGSSEQHKFRK